MNLKQANKIIVALMLLMVAGCGNHEVAVNKPAPGGSIDDQIKAAQNDPSLAPQAKAMIIGKLQQQQSKPSGSQ